jgi:hypothetical protein
MRLEATLRQLEYAAVLSFLRCVLTKIYCPKAEKVTVLRQTSETWI